jgi:hypothetical protein
MSISSCAARLVDVSLNLLQRADDLIKINERMSGCVKMLWGERRGHGTFGAVQRLPKELLHVATLSF